MRRSLGAGVAGVALAASALTACSSSSADTFSGAVLHRPYHAPSTTLSDTSGRPFSLTADTHKRLTLVFFGYTHCPDECPTTMATIASAMLELDPADRADTQVVFATTDPARDTRAVIRRWLDHIDPSFTGVTAPLPRIKHVATTLGVPVGHSRRLPSGGYDVMHGTPVLGMDRTHTVHVVWTLGTTAPQLAHDIHQLLT